MEEKEKNQENYLYFSSSDLISYFYNNLSEKDFKTQLKRIMEMARVYIAKKEFTLEDIYSVLVFVKDIKKREIVDEVFKLYFKKGHFPVRVIAQIEDVEETSDVEIEFSACSSDKKFINISQNEGEPYSQGVIVEEYFYSSGFGLQDVHLSNGEEFENRVTESIEQLKILLNSAGTDFSKIYSVMVYLKNMDRVSELEEVINQYFPNEESPLRQVMEVKQLYCDREFEIACSAFM